VLSYSYVAYLLENLVYAGSEKEAERIPVANAGSSKKMDGIVCLDLLEQYVSPQIETFEQEIVSRVIFMQDGAPLPHFSCFVTDVLNERFPDGWIGRGGPIPWPPRSPDLSPLDFFLWGVH